MTSKGVKELKHLKRKQEAINSNEDDFTQPETKQTANCGF